MSSNYWQIKKQSEQFKHGSTIESKIVSYVETWEKRCYPGGIPDDIPHTLAASGRVPSYRAIAMAILRNDHALKSLGFSGKHSEYFDMLRSEEYGDDINQVQIRLL